MEQQISGRPSQAGIDVSKDTAFNYSVVFDAVAIYGGTIGSLPWILYRRIDEKNKERHVDHPLYDCLHNQANPEMTSLVWREISMNHCLLQGNAYSQIIRNTKGQTMELWPLDPVLTDVKRNSNNKIYYELRVPAGKPEIFPAENILHIPGLGYDGRMGYSVLTLARESLGLGLAMEVFQSLFYGAGTNLGAIFEHPGKLGDTAHENLVKDLTAKYAGLFKSHKAIVLEEGMKYEKLGMPLQDAQFLECVIPGTLITMANGNRCLVESLVVGEKIMAWDGKKLVQAKIAVIGQRQRKNLIKIKTARGRELIASEDHPVLTLDRMRTDGGRHAEEKDIWRNMSDLNIGHYVRIAFGHLEKDDLLSFNKAYFLGAMTGDGYLREKGFSFSNSDTEILKKIITFVRSQGGDLRQSNEKSFNWYITTGKVGGKKSLLWQLLNDSGLIGKHSHDKIIPKNIINGGPEAWRGFLSGYFDTDGSIRDPDGKQTPSAYWASTSYELLKECQHLLSLLGIQSAIYDMYKNGPKIINGKKYEVRSGFGLYVMGISQLKKLAESLQILHKEKTRRLNKHLFQKPSRYCMTNFNYDRIISVKSIGDGEVIGLEISGYHTHITNGIITHNSRLFEISEFCRWFNLSAYKLKDYTRATFSNIEHLAIEFVQDSIRPWAVRFEQHVNWKCLDTNERKLYFNELLLDGLLRGDIESRNKALAVQRQNGVISADDWRAIENMNPLGGRVGTAIWQPLNMIDANSPPEEKPAKDVVEEDKKQLENLELRASRAIKSRRRMAGAFKPLFRDMERQILTKERKGVLKIVKKTLQRDVHDLNYEIGEFYTEFKSFVRKRFAALYTEYGAAIYPIAADEVNASPEIKAEFEAYIGEFADHASNRYIESSRGQLKQVALDHIGNDIAAAIEGRLDEWDEKRPDKVANREVIDGECGFAQFVYFDAGFRTAWVTLDESCPYCRSLDGVIISQGMNFINAGQSLQPAGAETPLIVTANISHPAAHGGCDCTLRAVL